MKSFDKLVKELDQFVATSRVSDSECMEYIPMYFSNLTGHVLAGIQILLPPTYEQEGRLLYISTALKVWFGEIDTAIDPEECAALGIPEEIPDQVRAGVYGGFRVVGQEGFQSLLQMATDDSILRSTMLESMAPGIKRLCGRAFSDIEVEYEMTQGETVLIRGSEDIADHPVNASRGSAD
jgi:hypothetical protein